MYKDKGEEELKLYTGVWRYMKEFQAINAVLRFDASHDRNISVMSKTEIVWQSKDTTDATYTGEHKSDEPGRD